MRRHRLAGRRTGVAVAALHEDHLLARRARQVAGQDRSVGGGRPWLATISAGTEIAAGLASNTVSPEEFGRVTDEVRTTPVILPVSRAAPLAAAVDPWLVPTSQTGPAARERAKSMARSIAAA